MIVQPNFLDHWKTRLLQSELGNDPLAPTYILRLWGHCQEQKTHRFPKLSAGALAAICCFKTAPEQLWLAMQSAGFIVVKNTVVEAHEWEEYNSGLIRSWNNGKKGGRKKKPIGSARLTQTEPRENLELTDREDKIDKIDKIDEKNKTVGRSAKASPASDAEWLESLTANAAYQGINVGLEYGKMQAWCGANSKQPTRRRFVNWLNRAERPMGRVVQLHAPKPEIEPKNWRKSLDAIIPGNTYEGSWATLAGSVKTQILDYENSRTA